MTSDILKSYLRRLTNLSSRNRSLLLTNLPVEQFLDWQALDYVENRAAFDVLKDIISQKKTTKLCTVMDSRSEKTNEISKRLRKIARTERFIEEERGSEDLYVAYPFVRGKLMDGTVIHAPLAFFPVTLSLSEITHARQAATADSNNEKAIWQLQRRAEPASLNRSFLLAYGHFNQIKIADELLESNLDDLSRDSLVFRTELYELLKNSGLSINFNKDLFQDQLQYFDAQSKSDLDLLERNGELKLYPEAVLGVFPQAGSYLAPDYETLIANEAWNNVFWQKELESHSSHALSKEANTFIAFAQDASQEQALLRVKQGESLVVQGPPGTGKSQLISNLMTDFAARGKRVLLVCQKRVALDVVYERLKQVNVTDFVALVHDFKNDRPALYAQLSAQIEQVEAYQKQNYDLEAIVVERRFLQTSRVIEQIVNELEAFKGALFEADDCGLSPKELYLTSNPSAPSVMLEAFQSFRFDYQLSVFTQKLNNYEQYQKHILTTHSWYERVSFAGIDFSEINTIKTTIADVTDWSNRIEETTKKQLYTKLDLLEILAIDAQRSEINKWIQSLDNQSVWSFFIKYSQNLFTEKYKKEYQRWLKNSGDLVQKKMIGDELESTQLMSFSIRLDQLIIARKSVLKWWLYSDKNYFKNTLAQQRLTFEINDLYEIQRRLQNRIEWEKALQMLEYEWEVSILDEKQSVSKVNLQECINHHTIAEKAYLSVAQKFGFFSALVVQNQGFMSLQKTIRSFLILCQQTTEKYQSWQSYLTQNQIFQLLKNPQYALQLQTSLDRDFDILAEADKLTAGFLNVEIEIIQRLESIPLAEGENLEMRFQNSLRLAWIAYLEEKKPILRAVSSLKISQLEQDLQEAIVQKQTLSQEVLWMQLRERTYKDMAFNRLQNRTTYRELQHQVTKKRKIWPVRKLMEHHTDEVFRLVPCWLASPETVSAVFPLAQGLFDLVIFDEASQCYAEYGIPAIFRGQQTVVVGDSKQLTPYDLYRVRYETENQEELPALEVESLLELAKQYLPETLLQGHYRSRSLDLIGFSNQHFYKNKLQLLPHFDDINTNEPAIHYIKVEGVWENNCNQAEAEKVIELVQMLQQTQPTSSVGVVTFNQPQQRLIEEKMPLIYFQKGLFIKNIENVQGDERDIIIFSVGYAPDFQGKLRAQFGSLNTQGGENRLNVAVTRARQKIYLITSIMPQQLHVEEATHAGPKLLKAYLQYALEVSEGQLLRTTNAELSVMNKSYHTLLKQKIQSGEIGQTNLPFADLTVKDNGRYESVILTDDNLYQQAISVKESHAYLPLQLRAKGWLFERIWSREWWRKQ